MTQALLPFPFYKWNNWGTGKWQHLPKLTVCKGQRRDLNMGSLTPEYQCWVWWKVKAHINQPHWSGPHRLALPQGLCTCCSCHLEALLPTLASPFWIMSQLRCLLLQEALPALLPKEAASFITLYQSHPLSTFSLWDYFIHLFIYPTSQLEC